MRWVSSTLSSLPMVSQVSLRAGAQPWHVLVDIPADEIFAFLKILFSLQLMGVPHNVDVECRYIEGIRGG